ncbi:MAG: His/Gly/Thr/Pro-type tRNA ligase C-terminal domain-containing protein [Patescibacteria group bacterium]|nr:His/Gly/Thr/Pro-type tRNA ligase C-terminal domain-containing protein [Patescibacteria group bacterium]
MRQSKLATKTLKETPKDADNISAALLIRAGFIDRIGSGIYSYLPLGWKILKKIEDIIREEMNAIGGQELLLPALHPREYWEATGRADLDAWYQVKSKQGKDFILGGTHEEIIAPVAKKMIFSYRDLPIYLYQIQTKFRDETRAKGGLLRGREFSMKDLYSFHVDQADLDSYYEKAKEAYFKVFNRCGIGNLTILTYSSGGPFSKFSHEFQTITESGEDTIYLCKKCNIAINKEIIDEQKTCPQCNGDDFEIKKAVEVGNIFKLGTKFSAPFEVNYLDEKGEKKDVIMGCYGMGPSRILGTIIEVHHDAKGMIWPEAIAPFQVHLLAVGESENVKNKAEELYKDLIAKNVEVLFDDRDESAGVKFADSDLLGIPYRVVVSEKTLKEDGVGLKKRSEGEEKIVKIEELINKLK